jgi:predicted nuclease with TOPRIM domain
MDPDSRRELVEALKEHFPTRDEMNERFDSVDARFTSVDARFTSVDARFASVDARFDRMDARFDGMDARFDRMDARFDRMDARFDEMDARFEERHRHVLILFESVRSDLQLVVEGLAMSNEQAERRSQEAHETLRKDFEAQDRGIYRFLDRRVSRLEDEVFGESGPTPR